jgi:hypothetical protein
VAKRLNSRARSGNLRPVLTDRAATRPYSNLLPMRIFLTFAILCSASCGRGDSEKQKDAPADAVKTPAGGRPRPEKNAIAHVPVGEFSAGSLPGEPGRDPALEPVASQIELGPFRIDAYPYPGDPTVPPRLGVSAVEAQALCASKEGRLCTELEWERACRGPESNIYPTGSEPCSESDDLCLSSFEVANMGSIPEWTASTFGKGSDVAGKPVVRGSKAQSPAKERRCSRRRVAEKEEAIGFRCCYGAPNARAQKEPTLGPPYTEVELTKADLEKLLESDARTRALAKDVTVFKPEAAQTVLARGPGETMGFTLTTQAVSWQPDRGSRFLVVTGRSGAKTSFVLVYFDFDKKKTLAGSFIMKNEPGPIALAYASSIRPRIHFSSCWGCPGETGKVLFRPPEELVLLQP